MTDRQPTKPNRYAVYDDAHNFLRYEYHERADEPTQAGDALNKANLLPDTVATALGLTGNPQVKDALEKIKTLIDGNTALANSKAKIVTGSYTGTGTWGSGNENRLTVSEETQVVIVLSTSENFPTTMFVRGGTKAYTIYGSRPLLQIVSWTSTQLSWYNEDGGVYQFNNSGWTYLYVAIG